VVGSAREGTYGCRGVWAERIARRFTPAEASFAAEVGMVYAAGGSERAELLPSHSVQPGAFGPGGWAELPMIRSCRRWPASVLPRTSITRGYALRSHLGPRHDEAHRVGLR